MTEQLTQAVATQRIWQWGTGLAQKWGHFFGLAPPLFWL